MPNDSAPRWLTAEEDATWRDLWSVMTWLPVRLEAQLRAEAGLALVEYHVLSQLSEAPGRTVRLSRLAAVTNTTLSHLSRVMTRLEKAGWVTRSPDPADGRATLGHLTEAGWAKVEQSAPAHVEAVRQVLFDQLTGEQSRQLGRAAGLVADAVVPATGRTGGRSLSTLAATGRTPLTDQASGSILGSSPDRTDNPPIPAEKT